MAEEKEKRKRGRPKKDGPIRNRAVHIRVTEAELDAFNELCALTGESKVDAMLESVRIRLNLERVKR